MFLMDILLQLRRLGKAMCVLLFDVCNGCSTSIKEINRLIWKGMSNIYYWEKLTFSKLRLSRKENLMKFTNFEEQKGARYIWGNVYICIIIFTCFSSTEPCLKFLLNRLGDKRLLSQLLWKWGWFQGHMNVSLNISPKN